MQMEDKSYDLYRQRFAAAAKGAEKDFYEKIAAEEKGHKLILLDYYEYMKDPGGWYVKAEHPSLDGGNLNIKNTISFPRLLKALVFRTKFTGWERELREGLHNDFKHREV